MPDSPFSYHSGLGVITVIFVLGVVVSISALAVSTVVLWRYRRAVVRMMSVAAKPTSVAPTAPPVVPAVGPDVSAPFPVADTLQREMTVSLNRCLSDYAAAGLVFALALGCCAFFAFSQSAINVLQAAGHPLTFLFWVWTAAWPMVLTAAVVVGIVRQLWLLATGYFVVLAALCSALAFTLTEPALQVGNVAIPAWSGETPMRLVAKWSLFNLVPTILFVMFRHRRVRAVAPLALSFTTVVAAGMLGLSMLAYLYRVPMLAVFSRMPGANDAAVSIGYGLALLGAALLLFGVLGWRLLVWLRGAYINKRVSDQSLAVDALWLIFATYYAVVLAFAGPGWVFTAFGAYALFKVAASAAQRLRATRRGDARRAPTLLVLRVFSLGKRSEALFDALTRRWRHIGNVQLIAGVDLAQTTVAPHRLLAFVSGKLERIFISGEAAMERALAALDTRRDADGRFRINDFFCHADYWQRVLARLIRSADVVLMDLRNFRDNNAGCAYEIKALLDTVPVARLVFVVDDTTDHAFFARTLAQAWHTLAPGSPNSALAADALQPLRLSGAGEHEVSRVLVQLCAALR